MSNEEIDDYLRLLFSRFGEVESISVSEFEKDQNINSRFAHVQFTKKSAVSAALKASENEYNDAGNEVASQFGLKPLNKLVKSIEEIKSMYAFIDENPSELKEEVDQFMQTFEENELSEKLDKEKRLNEADADGFMPVKNRNKRKKEVVLDSKQRSRKKKNKKQTELKNFYRFQIRQEKVEQLEELRKKFEEDKQRVAAMKDARKFKPF
eukprot:CAMPEP_0170067522 /NCGR_PEP_ID=MMETSP0019_2-20121128/6834_1 /TAXON_ID=98059 /ORGANISM="Dinobryon sp., Strain UTEXLB2267" /LENGTH=208 /DNA_ID=CAMNT_0010274925 /DNA_START=1571 /DNA_END=2197 /DNA_ORIENTATION=+